MLEMNSNMVSGGIAWTPGETDINPAVWYLSRTFPYLLATLRYRKRAFRPIVLFVKRACDHTTNTWRGIQTHCRRRAPPANRIRPDKILKSVSSPRGSTRVPGSLPSRAGANRSNADRDGQGTGGRRLPV